MDDQSPFTPEQEAAVSRAIEDGMQKASVTGDPSTVTVGVARGDGSFASYEEIRQGGATIRKDNASGRVYAEFGADTDSNGVPQATNRIDSSQDDHYQEDPVHTSPWNFYMLQGLLVESIVHAAAIETKADDYAYSGWQLKYRPEVQRMIDEGKLDAETLKADEARVRRWLETCANGRPIEDLCREVAIEYEMLGNAGFEILRTRSGHVHSILPIPFRDIRVVNEPKAEAQKIYAKFLQKRGTVRRWFLGLNDSIKFKDETFDPNFSPVEDFPDSEQARRDFIEYDEDAIVSYKTGKRDAASWDEYASEIYFLPRSPFTRSEVYGTPAGIQSVGAILAHKQIEAWNLQFFASKGVPQYAIVLEGLTPPSAALRNVQGEAEGHDGEPAVDPTTQVKNAIREFFKTELLAADRNVLVVTLTGNAKISFQKLSTNDIEASFPQYEKRATESIRMAHRIPPSAIGIMESANLGAGRDTSQMRRYRDHIIEPGQRRLAYVVNTVIRSGLLIPWFDFVFDPPDVENQSTLREYWLKAFIAGGISLNQSRPGPPCSDHPR